MQKRLDTGSDDAACDARLALVAEIADHLVGHRLADVAGATWTKTEHDPLIDPTHLNELRQFTSIIAVTYRTWEGGEV